MILNAPLTFQSPIMDSTERGPPIQCPNCGAFWCIAAISDTPPKDLLEMQRNVKRESVCGGLKDILRVYALFFKTFED